MIPSLKIALSLLLLVVVVGALASAFVTRPGIEEITPKKPAQTLEEKRRAVMEELRARKPEKLTVVGEDRG